MEIKVFSREDRDGCMCQRLVIDDKERQYVGHPEAEDAIIGRDLVSCSDIVEFMKEAYEAGKRGEVFTVSELPDTQD